MYNVSFIYAAVCMYKKSCVCVSQIIAYED